MFQRCYVGVLRSATMNEYYDKEIDRLHQKLARIYRLGRLTPTEEVAAEGLWARIEKLEVTKVKIEARENRNGR